MTLLKKVLVLLAISLSQTTNVVAQDPICESYELVKSSGALKNPILAAQFEHCADNSAENAVSEDPLCMHLERAGQLKNPNVAAQFKHCADTAAKKPAEKPENYLPIADRTKVKKLCFEIIDRRIHIQPAPWEIWDAIVASGMYPEEETKTFECEKGTCDNFYPPGFKTSSGLDTSHGWASVMDEVRRLIQNSLMTNQMQINKVLEEQMRERCQFEAKKFFLVAPRRL